MRYSLVLLSIFFFAFSQALPCIAEELKPLELGISVPLSGDLAEYGNAAKNGFLLAKEQEPKKFALVNYHFEDNRYDAAQSVKALQALRFQQSIDVLFEWGEAPLSATAPIAQQHKLPVIGMSVDKSPALGRDHIIRSINPAESFVALVHKELVKQGNKKFAIIRSEDPFLDAMEKAFSSLIDDPSNLTSISVSPSENDFRSIVLKLKRLEVDAVGVYLLPGQIASFYKQASNIGFTPKSFGTDIFESETEIKEARGAMEGAIFATLDVPTVFREAYKLRFGNTLQLPFAFNAYRVAELIQASVSKDSGMPLIERLERNAEDMKGISFSKTEAFGKYLEFKTILKIIKNGKPERY